MKLKRMNMLKNNSRTPGTYKLLDIEDVLYPGEMVESEHNFTSVSVNLTRSSYSRHVSDEPVPNIPDVVEDEKTAKVEKKQADPE